MTFDEQVAALRGKVEPKQWCGGKTSASPAQWAAHLDDKKRQYSAHANRNRERAREYYRRNRSARGQYDREYRQSNAETIRERRRLHRLANRDEINARNREWCRTHRPILSASDARRRRRDVRFRLALSLRGRLGNAVRRSYKSGSAVRDLGCSIADLKVHIERQWTGCMSWENWGSGPGTWQIDHVYPLAQTDLTDRAQLLAVCNWRNLQPLWFEDNVRKGDTVTPEAQQLFDGLASEFGGA
jgi:hypothetical protein